MGALEHRLSSLREVRLCTDATPKTDKRVASSALIRKANQADEATLIRRRTAIDAPGSAGNTSPGLGRHQDCNLRNFLDLVRPFDG